MSVETKIWMRHASSGHEDILSKRWVGDEKLAIVQISHGMSEHVERYNDFAEYLANHGFVVYMNEHAGHGEHADTLGFFADENGKEHVVTDMKTLHDEAVEDFPDLPVFLLGHSMGSFLARKYITHYGNELAGCILSGTSGSNPALGVGQLIANLQKKIKGPKSRGKFLTFMAFGSYLKRIKHPINANAWISRDDEVCKVYKNDKYCGFNFTAGGFSDLFSLLKEINQKDWAEKVPAQLPIYLFSGTEDPVGLYGKGVEEIFEKLRNSNHKDLTMKLYKGGRHEMLNELNKEEVYEDTLKWLQKHCQK